MSMPPSIESCLLVVARASLLAIANDSLPVIVLLSAFTNFLLHLLITFVSSPSVEAACEGSINTFLRSVPVPKLGSLMSLQLPVSYDRVLSAYVLNM